MKWTFVVVVGVAASCVRGTNESARTAEVKEQRQQNTHAKAAKTKAKQKGSGTSLLSVSESDCGDYRQVCSGESGPDWCCDLGSEDRPICCADTNAGCVYCFEDDAAAARVADATSSSSAAAREKVAPVAAASTTAAAAPPGPCFPLGEPIPGGKYKGSNAFHLCKEGERFKAALFGDTVELFISCGQNSLRSGWKWHIWCNSDGSRCGCNRDDFIGGQGACCNWSAGEHCTVNGGARPGQGGCAAF